MDFKKPSSTITAASLAGLGMTFAWEVVMQFFPELELRPTLVSGSSALVMALFGYYKKEMVLGK